MNTNLTFQMKILKIFFESLLARNLQKLLKLYKQLTDFEQTPQKLNNTEKICKLKLCNNHVYSY